MYKQLAFGLALALVATPTITNAQQEPQQQTKTLVVAQICDPVGVMMQTIQRYQEEPLFQTQTVTQHVSGEWFEGSSMFFVNQETGTYSMVTLYPDGTACMQATGTNFEPYSGPRIYTQD